MSSVCVIVPCYNEEQRLDTAAISAYLQNAPDGVGLLFVDDGSSDRTLDVLAGIREKHPERVEILPLESNRGKAEAVRAAVLHVAGRPGLELVGYWDADLATPLGEVDAFLKTFGKRPQLEIVLASRVKMLGRCIERRAVRHYLGRVFATFSSMLLGIAVYDTQCGAKMFRASLAPELFGDEFCSKWCFDVEVLARFICAKGQAHLYETVYELPLNTWRDVQGSKLKVFDFLRAPMELWAIHKRYGKRMRAWKKGAR